MARKIDLRPGVVTTAVQAEHRAFTKLGMKKPLAYFEGLPRWLGVGDRCWSCVLREISTQIAPSA